MKTKYPCPDFHLDANGKLGALLLKENVYTFHEALEHVHKLLYKRISNLENLDLVLSEKRGTCSSKHAFLAALAKENGNTSISLKLGYFKFGSSILPELKKEFEILGTDYIIEAHNYLRFKKQIIDVTSFSFDVQKLLSSKVLIEEISLESDQAGAYKQKLHESYFKKWCAEKNVDFEKAWALRWAIIDCLVRKNQAAPDGD